MCYSECGTYQSSPTCITSIILIYAYVLTTLYFLFQSFPRPSCQWSSPTLLSLSPLPRPLHPLSGTLGYNNGVTQVYKMHNVDCVINITGTHKIIINLAIFVYHAYHTLAHILYIGPAIAFQSPVTIDELVNRVGIDRDLLNQPCSTEHLTKIAPFVSNWHTYAIVLGVNQPQILSIKSDHTLEAEMKAQQVLSLWKKANGFNATYLALVDVCLQKNDVQLAESICKIVKG